MQEGTFDLVARLEDHAGQLQAHIKRVIGGLSRFTLEYDGYAAAQGKVTTFLGRDLAHIHTTYNFIEGQYHTIITLYDNRLTDFQSVDITPLDEKATIVRAYNAKN